MATQIQLRRGTTAQHNAFTGALAEVTYDTDKKTLVGHDGVTPGGFPLAKSSDAVPVNSQINSASAKTTPIDADLLGVVDSADSDNLKKLTFGNLGSWIWSKLGGLIAAGATKGTPVDTDTFPLSDSAAGDSSKIVSWANLKAALAAQAFLRWDGAQALTDAQKQQVQSNIGTTFRGYIYGLILSNNSTNNISVSAGEAANLTTGIPILIKLPSALIKQLSNNWAPGTNQGMRNSAAAIANTTYHIFLVAKAGGADADIYATTTTSISGVLSAIQAEPGGADYIYARRIGSIIRSGGSILQFTQIGDEFILNTTQIDVDVTNQGTSGILYALTVPLGIRVIAMIRVGAYHSSAARALVVTSVDESDQAPSPGNWADIQNTGSGLMDTMNILRWTNTSGQVRARGSDTNMTLRMRTYGWIDHREKLFTA